MAEVGGGGLWMALASELAVFGRGALVGEAADPVVEVIDCHQEDVVAPAGGAQDGGEEDKKADQEAHEKG